MAMLRISVLLLSVGLAVADQVATQLTDSAKLSLDDSEEGAATLSLEESAAELEGLEAESNDQTEAEEGEEDEEDEDEDDEDDEEDDDEEEGEQHNDQPFSKEQFQALFDQNQDGHVAFDEIKAILAQGYGTADIDEAGKISMLEKEDADFIADVKTLFDSADTNSDGSLSSEEIANGETLQQNLVFDIQEEEEPASLAQDVEESEDEDEDDDADEDSEEDESTDEDAGDTDGSEASEDQAESN